MNIFNRLLVIFGANFGAFVLSAILLPGFHVTRNVFAAALVIVLLSIIHVFIKPVLDLLFSPIILITLGTFSFIINAAIIYVVDIYSAGITIDSLGALLIATIIFTIANSIVLALARL